MNSETSKARRTTGWILSVLLALVVFLPVPGPTQAQQELPLEVQIDLAQVELERAYGRGDHASVLGLIDRLRALSPSHGAGEVLFFEAEAAIALDDLDRAETALTQFAATVGRSSELYTAALGMMLDLPRLRAEQAARQAAEAAAERRRQQEAERQRRIRAQQELERQEQARLAALALEERRVLNSLEVIRDVRFALHRRYGIGGSSYPWELQTPTTLAEPLLDTERAMLRHFLDEHSFNHLDRAALERLLRSPFVPVGPLPLLRTWEQYSEGDWTAYSYTSSGTSGRVCNAQTHADEFPSGAVYRVPYIFLGYDDDTGPNFIRMALLGANIFRGDRPITLRANDTDFRLEVRAGGNVLPVTGTWGDVVRAFQAGRRIEITGTDLFTNQPLTIGFSAMGFTAALRRAAQMCNRTSELSLWLRVR